MSREPGVSARLISALYPSMTSTAMAGPSHPCRTGSACCAGFWSQIWSQDPRLEPARSRLPVPSRR